MSTAKQVQSQSELHYVTHISETALQRLFERLRDANESMEEDELRDYLNEYFLAQEQEHTTPTPDFFTHQDTDGPVRYARLKHPSSRVWEGYYAVIRRNTNIQWREFQPWVMVTIINESQARQSYEQFKKKNPTAPNLEPLAKLAELRDKLPPGPEAQPVPSYHSPGERLPPFSQLPPISALQRKVEPGLLLTWVTREGVALSQNFENVPELTSFVEQLISDPTVDWSTLVTWRDPRPIKIKIELNL